MYVCVCVCVCEILTTREFLQWELIVNYSVFAFYVVKGDESIISKALSLFVILDYNYSLLLLFTH